ncbi:dTDP-4-dehydrorhamnose reductase [Burkholderia multivorans]|uniref:dTDP-4-dehydrorhamnose reductase n=1 Tax=Burkholderia ubonensis TaxID=101571 RepID=UPI000F6E8E77|nr:dTDP-4-dehydrorhamnose reductase [Burkholderia ubonensis]AYZ67541.1 dTDP-4-dehydrorhamnose reductase [Burkholderia multivorans]VWB64402.1 dTDP-4-dehydrorhamnose reductase [Burkholderia ubonensis]
MSRTNGPILILGASGQVGFELARTLSGLGTIISLDRAALSLDDPAAVRKVAVEVRPSVIVNAAAYTAVDRAETDAEAAKAVNADAPALLAECANSVDAGLIHYSTDYVFSGGRNCSGQDAGYRESDATGPLNVYGETKLLGEQAVVAIAKRHLVFRTSWVYGMRGKNFLLTMLRLARERDELKVVADQYGAPTWSRTIATLTGHVLAQKAAIGIDADDWWTEKSGIYHLTAAGVTTWADFAAEIFRLAISEEAKRPKVMRISSSEYPTPVARPANSVLCNDKLRSQFFLDPPAWQTALALCLREGTIGGV